MISILSCQGKGFGFCFVDSGEPLKNLKDRGEVTCSRKDEHRGMNR